tara:strand:+ start:309 stop:941 length:633 start_codon:yes stop_codon:yes gene_type:complete
MFTLKKYLNSFLYKTSQYSQAGQDIFAEELFGDSGVYIDVGSGEPAKFSNTYMLEVKKKWKGFGVDIGSLNPGKAQELKNLWTKYPERKNKIYWEDAVTFNYKKALNDHNLSLNIDYLSCDIDPQEKTFYALKKVISDDVRPNLITFETDLYREKKDYSLLAYDFLKPYGYKYAVKNVYSSLKKKKIFETWFVKNSVKFETIEYKDWVKK